MCYRRYRHKPKRINLATKIIWAIAIGLIIADYFRKPKKPKR